MRHILEDPGRYWSRPRMRKAAEHIAPNPGRDGWKGIRIRDHPRRHAANYPRGCRRESAHHARQEDHARARPAPEGTQESPRQQDRQEGRAGLAVPLQQARFMPGKGRIHRPHAGRGILHPRRDRRPQVRSPPGKPVGVPYTGSHEKITAYGSIAKDGRQFFRTYERFDADTFVRYLKGLRRHFGKVAVTVDRASPHRARLVRIPAQERGRQGHLPPERFSVPQRDGRGVARVEAGDPRVRIPWDP